MEFPRFLPPCFVRWASLPALVRSEEAARSRRLDSLLARACKQERHGPVQQVEGRRDVPQKGRRRGRDRLRTSGRTSRKRRSCTLLHPQAFLHLPGKCGSLLEVHSPRTNSAKLQTRLSNPRDHSNSILPAIDLGLCGFDRRKVARLLLAMIVALEIVTIRCRSANREVTNVKKRVLSPAGRARIAAAARRRWAKARKQAQKAAAQ